MRSILRLHCCDITSRIWASMPSRQNRRSAGVEPVLCARHLQQSASSVLSPTARFSRLTSFRSVSREFGGGPRYLPPVRADRARDTTAADGRQFLRRLHVVVTLLQSRNRVLPKGLRKLAHSRLGHLPPSWCKCAHVGCFNLGVSPQHLPVVVSDGV